MVVKERQKEYESLGDVLSTFLRTEEGGIVYISGVPGSGKTHTVSELLKDSGCLYVFLNAASFRTKKDVYRRVLASLGCAGARKPPFLSSLRAHLTACASPHVVVIDEADLLITRKQEILYNTSDLPYLERSKLLLVLISNTMDLPERILDPKVCSRIGRRQINFAPYTAAQLESIAGVADIDRTSVELAARRVGAVSGDARRMLDILDRAREDKGDGCIGASDIDGVMRRMYAPVYTSYLQSLSYYQKALLCVLESAEGKHMKINMVYEEFIAFCRRKDMDLIGYLEFRDIVDLMVRYGILKYRNNAREVVLMILHEEIKRAMATDAEYMGMSKRPFSDEDALRD
jgi:origin recognition complex subunit 1